jgi:2-hydroxychromene-2-carboxylate isomerase
MERPIMSKTVECLFDLGSPYSYLAWHQLPKIAAARGARIIWQPILVGAVFQATGNHAPIETPNKALYSLIDLQRWAKHYGVNFTMNPHFPINTLALMRGAVAMQAEGEEVYLRYLSAMFKALFEEPRNLNLPEEIGKVLQENGFDPMALMAKIGEQAVKDQLRKNTEQAVARGAFGAPTFFVGKEMFWGQDRLDFVDAALADAALADAALAD